MTPVIATAVQGFEEKYTLYRNIYLYCGIAALVFLAIAILLFIVLRIPQVFGELTGRTARKAVEEMTSGKPVQAKRITKKKETGKKKSQKSDHTEPQKKQVYSDLIGENDTPVSLVTHDDIPTPTLMPRKEEEMETSVLGEGETEVLTNDTMETSVLSSQEYETTVLQGAGEPETDILQPEDTVMEMQDADFIVVRSIVEIHTDEVIGR